MNSPAEVKPYKKDGSSRKEEVEQMFDAIAHRYDFLNQILSFGVHKRWRKKLLRSFNPSLHRNVLDIATGTGELALAFSKSKIDRVAGLDPSRGMLDVALKKVEKTRLQTQPEFYKGFAEELPFRDGEFHFISCAFGVRNFHNLDAGLREMHRVLTSGGKAEILEFSKPCGGLFATLFKFYFKRILPVLGRLISKDPAAYTYLPESVGAFPSGMAFVKHLEAAGFRDITARPLTFGTVTLYSGIK